MDRELLILNAIIEDNTISQRKLSKLAGVSLGTINSAIQGLAKEGFLQINDDDQRNVKYLITQKGWELRADKSYLAMVDCYNIISKMKATLKQTLSRLCTNGRSRFYIDGEKDEVYRLVKMTLIEAKRDIELTYDDYNPTNSFENNDDVCILYWDTNKKYPKGLAASNIFMN